MHAALPAEVWNLVLEQVYLMPWTRRVTLRNVCLVNFRLCSLAMPWLYRQVKISRRSAWRGCDAFYTIHEYRRDLAHHVQVLILECPWGDNHYSNQEPWVRNWINAFALCTELVEVEIRHPYSCTMLQFSNTLSRLMTNLQTLTRLKTLTLELQPPAPDLALPPTSPVLAEVSGPASMKLNHLRRLSIGTLDAYDHRFLLQQVHPALVADTLTDFNLTLTFNDRSNSILSTESRQILMKVTKLRIVPPTIFPLETLTVPTHLRELIISYDWRVFVDVRSLPSIPTLLHLVIDAGCPRGEDVVLITRVITSLTFQARLISLTIQCSTYNNDWTARIEDPDFARMLPESLEVFSSRIAMTLSVASVLYENCKRLRGLGASFQRKADLESFIGTIQTNARPLECGQLWCWDYVSFSIARASQCIINIPTLRHIAVNSLGWFCLPRTQSPIHMRGGRRGVVNLQQVVTFHETCVLIR